MSTEDRDTALHSRKQEEQDQWLAESHDAINAKLRRGIAQLDRGEGIPDDQLDARLKSLKIKSK